MTRPRAFADHASAGSEAVVAELRLTNRLLAAIATRGLEPRDAVVLLDAVGMTSSQIGTVLRIKATTARVLLHRARKAEGGRRSDVVESLAGDDDGEG